MSNKADKWDKDTNVSPSIGLLGRMTDEELIEEEFNAVVAGMYDYAETLRVALEERGLKSAWGE